MVDPKCVADQNQGWETEGRTGGLSPTDNTRHSHTNHESLRIGQYKDSRTWLYPAIGLTKPTMMK